MLVVSGLVVATVLRGRETPLDLNTPAGVVLAFAKAEQRGDGEAAWALLATSVQERNDREHFLARFGNTGRDREYLSIEDGQGTSDTYTVVLVRTYSGSGGLFGSSSYSSRNTVRLIREAVGWRITVPPDDYLLQPKKP